MSDQDDVERRLSATDFSADSRVRASLRAKLLSRRPAARFAPMRVAGLALALAAAALPLLLPLRSRLQRAGAAEVAARVFLPPAAPRQPGTRLPPARKTAFPRGELGLPILPGVLAAAAASAEESPFSSRTIDRLIEIHRGRAVRGRDARAVVWEIDGVRYGLETRRITLDDLFVKTRAL